MKAQRLLYACTVFFSSALLFLIQPIVARMILPAFGGSAAVWTTCALFFQAMLLAGYLYSHWTTRRLNPSRQAVLHLTLLAVSLAFLYLGRGTPMEYGGGRPLLSILGLLELSVGLPYFLLATTGPLVQVWYARTNPGVVPYRLYALSNSASLLALISYPVVFERHLSLYSQNVLWNGTYLMFVALCGVSAWLARRGPAPAPAVQRADTGTTRALWLTLAFCPSVLWLAVANHLSQSVAAIPLLWVLPLTLYLLSFVVCFDSDRWYRPALFRWLLPPAWLAMAFGIASEAFLFDFKWIIAIFSVSLFVICVFCHGELARRKPNSGELTGFYLWVALGGVFGSVFVALIAPVIFRQYFELPVSVVLSILLGIALVYRSLSRKHLVRLVITCGAAFVYAIWFSPAQSGVRLEQRNFYGALRVVDEGSVETASRSLFNGRILHGVQWLSPNRSRWTTTYYSPESGVGRVLAGVPPSPVRVGAIGLGIGTVASYARQGDSYRFYEINPLVIRVARADFRFLSDCRAKWQVAEGDGRLALEQEPAHEFDILVLDAFSGDSIPIHLLTREAFELYFSRLQPAGVLAVHVTNKYLELGSLVGRTADELGWEATAVHNIADPMRKVSAADWIVVRPKGGANGDLGGAGRPVARRPGLRIWTDDFSNLFQVLH